MPSPKFFPVVHLFDDAQGRREADKARDAGADGVFFIHHAGDDAMAVRVAHATKKDKPEWYVGINLLASGPVAAFERAIEAGLDAVWADAVGVSAHGLDFTGHELRRLHAAHRFIDIFAGVAFKYQPEDTNPCATVYRLSDLGWVPCTSGKATGCAAELDKVVGLATASSTGLALASGVTLDNVIDYLPHVTHFFVASDISQDDYTLDFERMSAIAGKIHQVR